MIARILPPEEWPRLAGTEAETVWPLMNPETSRVLVVEDGGKIVATVTGLRVVHAECLWVAPEYRGKFSVAWRLFKGLREIAAEWGVMRVIAAAKSEKMMDLIFRSGGELMQCDMFLLPVDGPRGGTTCRKQ